MRWLLTISALTLVLVPVVGAVPAEAGFAASAVAGGGIAGAQPVGRPQAGSLSCTGGDYYTVESDGTVSLVPSNNGTPVYHGAEKVFRFKREGKKSKFNGLAIGSNGTVAWAFNKGDSKEEEVGIYRWEAETGEGERVFLSELPDGQFGSPDISSLVAGGVNPSDPAGEYYFGGFVQKKRGTYFTTYKYSGGRIVLVGYVQVLDHDSDKGNGDLVFSASGDMFVLWNDGEGDTRIVPVRREALAAATGGVIPHGDISKLKTGEGRYNGLAFDSDGRLIIQYDKSGKSYNYSIDPDDGTTLSDKVSIGVGDGSDLASCAAPPTLYVQKDVVGREKPSDQFTISVEGKGGTPRSSETTSGTGTGIQAAIGVFTLFKPRTYTIKETAANGANLSDYSTTLSCVDAATDEELPVTRVKDTEYTFVQSGADNHDAICTLRNEPRPKTGSVSWRKTDTGRKALPGSAWQIIPDAAGQPTIEVTDNTGDAGYSGRDKDTAVAAFTVSDLPLGSYTLRESTVPEGYVGAPDKHFTIAKQHSASPNKLGDIQNKPIKGKVTWVKTKADGTPLDGSTWTFTPTNPSGNARTITDCTSAPCAAGGDQNPTPGRFELRDVPYGTYSLQELKAPDGYVKSEETKALKVTTDGATVAVGEMVNQALPQVSWTKTKPDGSLLGGSTWTWKPSAPAGPAEEIADCVKPSAEKCTGPDKDPAAGKFLLKGVKAGSYTLVESHQPEGYQLDPTEHKVEVKPTDAGKTVNAGAFKNQPAAGSVTWSKVDAGNGQALAGSVWTLSGPAGGAGARDLVVADCVEKDAASCSGPDKDPAAGRFKVEGLGLGKYSLVEKAAPSGFRLDTTQHPFQLAADHLDHAFAEPFVNKRASVPRLPLTGGRGAHIFLIAGAVVSAVAISTGLLRRRRHRNLD